MSQLPMLAVSWLGGIAVVQLFPELPTLAGYALATCLIFLFVLGRQFPASRVPVIFLAGVLWAIANGNALLSQRLDPGLESRDIEVQGIVETIPVKKFQGVGFEFLVEHAFYNGEAVRLPRRIRLRSYNRKGGGTGQFHSGESWRMTVRLKAPHSYQNPGGFDYEAYLFRKGIGATGYIRQQPIPKKILNSPWLSTNYWREWLLQRVTRQCLGSDYCGLTIGLLLGHRDNISQAQWQTLKTTGTIHLMAISGLHIGLLAGFAYGVTRRTWSFFPSLANRIAAPRVAAASAVLGSLVYAALAGFTIPTTRALIMVTVVMVGIARQQPSWFSHYLAMALIIVLLVQPLAVLDPGFWLSFSAVFLIAFTLSSNRHLGRVRQLFYVQLGIFVGLLPILLFWFGQGSLSAPLANLVAVPLFGILIVPVILLGGLWSALYTGQGNLFFDVADNLFAGLWVLLEYLSEAHYQWSPLNGSTLLLLLALLGSLLLLTPRGWPGRWLGCCLWLPVLVTTNERPDNGEHWLTMLDVGQGLAVVIETKKHLLLFDSGPGFGSGFNAGDAAVIPFLRYIGRPRLDMLVVSHGDNDHIGGARTLISQLDIKNIVTNKTDNLPDARACGRYPDWEWDGVRFSFLHPDASPAIDENDSGCVLLVHGPYGTSLHPADIGRKAEQALVEKTGSRLQSNVLVVPHHGSKTSSSSEFLDQIRPRMALLSAGYRNRYRHPHKRIKQRYARRAIPVYSTADHGAVMVRLEKEGLSVRKYRQKARRYWHHRTTP